MEYYIYKSEEEEIYNSKYHCHMNKKLAEWAISCMRKESPTSGELEPIKKKTIEEFDEFLKTNKLNIPDDVSVISFDDNTYLDYLNPPVTRIKQPVTDIAETAINLLIQAIAKKEQLQANICMAPSIVLRNSIKHLH